MDSSRLSVLHATEASLGGLRRHVADLIQGLHSLGVRQGLVYSPKRADSGMKAAVAWCANAGVQVFEVAMERRIAPVADVYAGIRLHKIARAFGADVLHLHSAKGRNASDCAWLASCSKGAA